MRGKMMGMIKKWWLVVLVSTLAMSLTSCSKKKALTEGEYDCPGGVDGGLPSIGDFTLYVTPSGAGEYKLTLQPRGNVTSGDYAYIALADFSTNPPDFQPMLNEVILDGRSSIHVGVVTEDYLNRFPYLAIEGYTTQDFGLDWGSRRPAKATYCVLPQPSPDFTQASGQ